MTSVYHRAEGKDERKKKEEREWRECTNVKER